MKIAKKFATIEQYNKVEHLRELPGFAGQFARNLLFGPCPVLKLTEKQAALLDKLADENAHKKCRWSRCHNCFPNDGEEFAS